MNKKKILSVKDLTVSFFTKAGEVQAVRGASWDLYEKETIAIVGESGCGKTVSIQTVMGLLQKPVGRIKKEQSNSTEKTSSDILQSNTERFRAIP